MDVKVIAAAQNIVVLVLILALEFFVPTDYMRNSFLRLMCAAAPMNLASVVGGDGEKRGRTGAGNLRKDAELRQDNGSERGTGPQTCGGVPEAQSKLSDFHVLRGEGGEKTILFDNLQEVFSVL